MYTLNLLFDFNRNTGRFSGDATSASGALNTSMNWLRLRGTEPSAADLAKFFRSASAPTFTPENNSLWDDLQEATSTLLLSILGSPPPGNICLRVAPDPDAAAPPSDANVQLVVCFGRPPKARQPQASPFTDSGAVRTTFVFGPIPMNSPGGLDVNGASRAGNLAWFFPLGAMAPQTRPNDRNKTHRYEFALGVIVTSATSGTRHYGEDPEMDIGD